MNHKALHNLSYGLYVISSRKGDRFNGQIANPTWTPGLYSVAPTGTARTTKDAQIKTTKTFSSLSSMVLPYRLFIEGPNFPIGLHQNGSLIQMCYQSLVCYAYGGGAGGGGGTGEGGGGKS